MQRRPFVFTSALLPLVACTSVPRAAIDFDGWSETFAQQWLRLSPPFATSLQYLPEDEQAQLDGLLTLDGDAERAKRLALARQGLAQLDDLAPGGLTPAQSTSAATLRWALTRVLDAAADVEHSFVFNQNAGLHLQQVTLLSQTQPLRRARDVPAYLGRLALMPAQLDDGIARARRAAQRGLLPPRFIAERARGQVASLLAASADSSPLVTSLARRSEAVEDLSPESRRAALLRATALVQDGMRPAWQRVLTLIAELLPRTSDDAGLWRLPGGDAVYARALVANTTTRLTAAQIHATGLAEVTRIEAQIDAVLRRLGRHEGTVRERVDALRLALQPAVEPDPRPALLERYAVAVRDNQKRSAALFPRQPAAPVEVRRVPALTERTASAYYTSPALDGSRPGVFWVPLPGPAFDTLRLRTLAVHEAVPGHHFQIALQQEASELPRWRRARLFGGGSAHSEGWALYAERLAIEQGWYDDDPTGLIGALDGQLFRARRLVVDTGMHAMRWTRQQAIDYGIPAQEVERYVANPGQACAYMIGMLRMLSLRQEAQQRLGARFSLPAFHDLVLSTGSVPLDVLGEVVARWV